MPILHHDFETRSTLSLPAAGAWRYAADPSTEVLCIGFAVDDGPVQIWTPGQQIPDVFHEAARDAGWIVVAHNDAFETAIEARLLHPRHGWPLVPIERHRCTMAAALACALPGSLEGAAETLSLPIEKDREGRRLMLQMARPRRPRKGEDPNQVYWHDDGERRSRLADYCRRDVEVERELYRRLPHYRRKSRRCGFSTRRSTAAASTSIAISPVVRAIVRAEAAAIDAEVAELTGGAVTSINQVARLTALVRARGHEVAGLTQRSVAALLARDPSPNVRRLLELRRQGARAAAPKLDSLLAGADADHRMRGTLRYFGASTGRWSGSRFQPHNLRRTSGEGIDDAIEAVRSGDLARVRSLGAPLAVVGELSRSMICAAPGHVLIGADFSAIESRVWRGSPARPGSSTPTGNSTEPATSRSSRTASSPRASSAAQ
jgi:DNA polymerase